MYVPIKIQQLIFLFCIFWYFVGNIPDQVAEAKSTPTIQTWVTVHTKIPKTTSTWKVLEIKDCNAGCKMLELEKLWIRHEIAEALVWNCKALADNPTMCIKIWASIVFNESGGGYHCRKYNKYNCFWLQVKDNYKSYNDWVLHWVWKYNKKWYKWYSMWYFYSPAWKLPPTRYCTSEQSSNTAIGCPFWLKTSQNFFNSLPF